MGDLMLNILASFAQFERALIAERVRVGMARARKQGRHLGRPRAVNGEWMQVRLLIDVGQITQVEAARRLHVSRATIFRLLRERGSKSQDRSLEQM